ncbi:MAG: thioredoxin fold domain-containing protein [Candidatus Krumholzibacteriota bacterium]
MAMIRTRSVGTTWAAIILLIVSLSAAAALGAEEKEDNRAINWLGFNEALSQGRDFDKPAFLHFTAPWCKWCKKMQRETYKDPKVIRYLNENFTAVMIDTEKLPALARKYRVESLPTLWFLDSQGKGLTNIKGYVGPEKLLRVLEYVSTKAYEKVDYQTWVRKHSAR